MTLPAFLVTFLWIYFPLIALCIIYTGVAGLHSCADGRCWFDDGHWQEICFAFTVAGLAYTQVSMHSKKAVPAHALLPDISNFSQYQGPPEGAASKAMGTCGPRDILLAGRR